jgi:hypothetical protein
MFTLIFTLVFISLLFVIALLKSSAEKAEKTAYEAEIENKQIKTQLEQLEWEAKIREWRKRGHQKSNS